MSATVDEMETESERAAAHYAKIREQEYKCRQLELAVSETKEAYVAAKDTLKEAVARLRMLIRGGPDEQLQLALEDGDPVDAEFEGRGEAEWDRILRTTRIEDAIPLHRAERDAFAAMGIETVKQFEDLRAGKIDGYPRGLVSVKGFGKAKITKYENAILDWYKQWQGMLGDDSE